MNHKLAGKVAGIGILTFAAGLVAYMARQPASKEEPKNALAKFGRQRNIAYGFAPQEYEGTDHRMSSGSMLGRNWGKIYVDQHGRYQIWGDLDGAHFLYSSSGTLGGGPLLSVRKGYSNITLIDNPPLDEHTKNKELERQASRDKLDPQRSILPVTEKYLRDSFQALYSD